MSIEKISKSCAIILGGHVNGYSIVKELFYCGIKEIVLFETGNSICGHSNKIKHTVKTENSKESLKRELFLLREKYDYLVLYPTDDLFVENLASIGNEISDFCFLPFNIDNISSISDKAIQYKICEEIGIPYPITVSVNTVSEIDNILEIPFPILLKPTVRKDLTISVFRSQTILSLEDFDSIKSYIVERILLGVNFIASEIIPGDDTNIYAYTCFRSKERIILNEWTGKKLTQFPGNFGVFSSASNEAPEVILTQGRLLVEKFDAFGIVEPEFRYDERDGKYKLMETNMRPMMWNGLGSASGVYLHETQFNYALGLNVDQYIQNKAEKIHYVLSFHEIPNLISRASYWGHFRNNLFGGDRRVWVIYDRNDIGPFIYSLSILLKKSVGACLRRLSIK